MVITLNKKIIIKNFNYTPFSTFFSLSRVLSLTGIKRKTLYFFFYRTGRKLKRVQNYLKVHLVQTICVSASKHRIKQKEKFGSRMLNPLTAYLSTLYKTIRVKSQVYEKLCFFLPYFRSRREAARQRSRINKNRLYLPFAALC